MGRGIKRIAIGILALLVLVVILAAAALHFIGLDNLVNQQIAVQKPAIEKQLGRKVNLGTVTTHLFPLLGGEIAAVSIAQDPAHPEDDRPLLSIGSVEFDLELIPAILSFGKDLEIKELRVNRLQVNLVRYPSGVLSYQDILDRLNAQPAEAPSQPATPASPSSTDDLLRRLTILEIRLSEGQFRLADHHTPTGKVAEDFVKHFNLEVQDVKVGKPIKLVISAAVFAEAKNFSLDVTTGPLQADPASGLFVSQVDLDAEGLDLSRLAPYLGQDGLQSALATATWKITQESAEKPFHLEGKVDVKGVQMAGGEGFDVKAAAKLTADPAGLGLDVSQLDVQVGKASLSASGSASNLATKPELARFVLTSTFDPADLLAYYPQAKQSMPPGVHLAGPVSIFLHAGQDVDQVKDGLPAKGSGKQQFSAGIDLTQLDILYPGTLIKPAQVALAFKAAGDLDPSGANISSLTLQVDDLDIEGHGTIKNLKKPDIDFTASAKPFSFDRLVRLLPAAKQGLESAHATATGQGHFDAHFKGGAAAVDAALDLGLAGLKLDVPDMRIDGALSLKATAVGDPSKSLHATVNLDAGQSVIFMKDVLNKAASTPMVLTVDVQRQPELISVDTFKLQLANLSLDAHGTLNLAQGTTDLKVSMAPLDLEKLAQTVTAIPPELAKHSQIDLKIAVDGNPNKMETLNVVLDPLDAQIGSSDLHGSAKVANLVKPDAQVVLTSKNLNLDELFPPSKASSSSASNSSSSAARADDPALKKYRFSGQMSIKRLITHQTDISNFQGVVKLADGVLTLDKCTCGVFGGTLDASGTDLEIWKGVTPFKAHLIAKGIDMNQALTTETQYGNTLAGKGDVQLDLTGVGFTTAEMSRSLNGKGTTDIKNGKFLVANITQSVAGNLMGTLQSIPGLKLGKVASDGSFRELLAHLTIKDGKIVLDQPITTEVDDNKLSLGGGIAIDGNLGLQGTYTLRKQMVASLTGGKCGSQDLPIPVNITGPVKKPGIAPDVSGAGKNLVTACFGGAVADKLKGAATQAAAAAAAQGKQAAQQAAAAAVKGGPQAAKQAVQQGGKAAAKGAGQDAKKALKGFGL